MKLDIKHLAPYLPYGLKIDTNGYFDEIVLTSTELDTVLENQWKPLLRSPFKINSLLMEIYNDTGCCDVDVVSMKYVIGVNYKLMGEDFHDIIYANGKFDSCPMFVYSKLIENHVDVFGLIPEGLAIDINEQNY